MTASKSRGGSEFELDQVSFSEVGKCPAGLMNLAFWGQLAKGALGVSVQKALSKLHIWLWHCTAGQQHEMMRGVQLYVSESFIQIHSEVTAKLGGEVRTCVGFTKPT